MSYLRFCFLFILFLFNYSANAQNISKLSTGLDFYVDCLYYDTTDTILYTGGSFSNTGSNINVNHIAKWDGTNWDSLSSGALYGGVMRSILRYNNLIYAGGSFDLFGGVASKGIGSWDGASWNFVANLTNAQGYGCVWEIFVDNSELFIGGCFEFANGQLANGLVKFDGLNWTSFPNISLSAINISAIEKYNGELYVGGNFNSGGGKNDVAKWDGSNWVSVGGGLSGGNTVVDDMIVYKGELYISGHFLTLYGDPGNLIAKWNGTSWSSVGSGLDGGNCFAMEIFNNELYVGGTLISAGGIPVNNIAKWDGTSWHNIGANFNNAVTCLEAKDSSSLFIGGGFTTVNGDTVNNICEYNFLTGFNEVSNQTEIQISPNPATNFIDIQSTSGFINNIQLIDISGKIVLEQSDDEILNCRINVSSVANGIYFVKVVSDKNIYVEKMVIQKL